MTQRYFKRATTTLWAALALCTSGPAIAQDAACDRVFTTSDLQLTVERAEKAFSDVDLDGFREEVKALQSSLACLEDPLPRYAAASIHRAQGLSSFVDRDVERATQAFTAARSIEPQYRFPDTMVPGGHPLLIAYDSGMPDEEAVETAPRAPGGHVRFDGRPSNQRPTDRPTVLQVINDDGAVRLSSYVWPEQSLPDYGGKVDDSQARTREPREPHEPRERTPGQGRRWALLGGAAGAAVASGALYALGAGAASDHADPSTPYADLDGLKRKANAMVVGSGAAGAVAVGLGAFAVVELRW